MESLKGTLESLRVEDSNLELLYKTEFGHDESWRARGVVQIHCVLWATPGNDHFLGIRLGL